MKKNRWLTATALGLLSACFLTGSPMPSDAGTLPPGIKIGGLELTGLTKEEADQKIEEYVNKMADQSVILSVGGNEVHIKASELGFYWSNQDEIEEAQNLYEGGNLLKRYLNLKALEKEPVNLEIETSMDSEKIAAFVAEKCSNYVKPAQDAVITREKGGFSITDSVPGMEIDIEATKKNLEEAMKQGLDQPVKAEAVIKEMQPAKTKELLSTIQNELGTFSTNFSAGNVSRSKNLRVGASKVNGWVLMPGEEFSAYQCLAPFTVANGYASASAYENGRVVDSIGGGACQLCTTLYNAALRAEMEITQRQNHSMVVGYVKASEDAAIAGTFKDLKFKNNYDTPVYIEGAVKGSTLTFAIYGKETRPANRTIKFISETLGTIDPGTPTMKVDPSLPPGKQVKVQSGHVGKRSRLWKCVYIDGVETEKKVLHTDSYMPSKAIMRVGPEAPAVAAPVETIPETQPPIETQPTESIPAGPASEIAAPAEPVAPVVPAPQPPSLEGAGVS